MEYVHLQKERAAAIAGLSGRESESILSREIPPLERNEHNAAILDAYALEVQERNKVEILEVRLRELEAEGNQDPARIDALKAEIGTKKAWMNKDVLGKLWPVEEI